MGDVEAVRYFMEMGASPGMTMGERSMLSFACNAHTIIGQSSTPVVRLLLDKGARVDEVLPNGEHVIDEALRRGQVDSARLLLDAGSPLPAPETLEWIRHQGRGWMEDRPAGFPGLLDELDHLLDRAVLGTVLPESGSPGLVRPHRI
jgi:hypothetical protein